MEKSAEFAPGSSEEEEDFIIRRPKRSKKSAFKEKLDRVEELVKQLRDMHGNQFSNFQYKLWAETYDVETHGSLETPPEVPLFGSKKRHDDKGKASCTESIARAMTTFGTAVVAALSPATHLGMSPHRPCGDAVPTSTSTPSKIADTRSKYIAQLRELHLLFDCEALTRDEYEEQKQTILHHLKVLRIRVDFHSTY